MKQIITLLIAVALFSFISCSSDNPNNGIEQIEIVNRTTTENAEITYTTIKISGEIISDNLNNVSSRGVCWSTNPNPTVDDNVINSQNNILSQTINELTANTKYYFRIFAINNSGVTYGENLSFNTLSLNDTVWKFATYYPPGPNTIGVTLYSRVDLYGDKTTRFDELDLPMHCPGCFITFGTWSLNGNVLTYIWEGNDPNSSTYVYTGILNGMTINGTFTHPTIPGTWNAIPLN